MIKNNRNFGKLSESGVFEYAPVPLVIDGENVWTNISGVYLGQGYYPIEKTEQPVKEGYYYTSYWEQENDTIVQKWEEHEIVEEPAAEYASDEEIQAAITEGVNSIDS